MPMYNLDFCPYCGSLPCHIRGTKGAVIRCNNKGCAVRPVVVNITTRSAAAAWNYMSEKVRCIREEGKPMTENQRCPICGQEYTGAPALSRTDNQTLICPDCGTRQALAAIGVSNPEAVISRIHDYETRKAQEEQA